MNIALEEKEVVLVPRIDVRDAQRVARDMRGGAQSCQTQAVADASDSLFVIN